MGAGRTQANRAGWNNSDVDIEFECGDELSGVASCPGPQQLTQEGAEQTAVGIATDRAGNAQAFDYRHINIDKTPPTITAKRAPALDADGKPTGATAAVFTCSDALSGVSVAPTPSCWTTTTPGSRSPAPRPTGPGTRSCRSSRSGSSVPRRPSRCARPRRPAGFSPSLRPSSEQQTIKSTERTCASGPGATEPSESALALCASRAAGDTPRYVAASRRFKPPFGARPSGSLLDGLATSVQIRR